ncbi:hypothetical protein NL676_019980 [Syzygium grande]|nr:hypothetical protein NL676_019980 [Syzygium grande]
MRESGHDSRGGRLRGGTVMAECGQEFGGDDDAVSDFSWFPADSAGFLSFPTDYPLREPETSDNGKQVANREDALLLEVATSSQEIHFAAEASEHGKATFSSPSTDLLDTGNYAPGLQDMRELHR